MLLDELSNGWVDGNGLVSPEPCDPTNLNSASGNGVLYTAEAILTLDRRGELTPGALALWMHSLSRCFVDSGLLARAPLGKSFALDIEQIDDYHGILAVSARFDYRVAEEILDYGRNVRVKIGPLRLPFWYNSTNPSDPLRDIRSGKIAWSACFFPRFPQLVAAMYWAAHKKAPWYLNFYAALVVVIACFAKRTNTDAPMLTWLLCYTNTHALLPSKLVSLAEKLWRWQYKRQWGEEASGICGRTMNRNHPLGRYFVF